MSNILTPLQRRLVGASLIAFVAFLYAQDAVDPTDAADNAERVTLAAAHPNRLTAAAVLLFLSSVFMLPGIAAIVAVVRERGKWLARIGGGLAVLGALGHVGVATYYGVLSGLAGGDPAQMEALLDRLDASTTAGVVLVPAIAGFALGVFLLGFALARSRVLPRWAVLVPLAGLVVEIIHVQPWPQVDAAQAVAVVPFAWLGLRLLDRGPSRTPGAEPAAA